MIDHPEIGAAGVIYRSDGPYRDKPPACSGMRISPPRDEVEAARAWILLYSEPQKTINMMHSSYELKHIIEHMLLATGSKTPYICNGACIAAFLELGYECDVIGPNGYFNFKYIGPKVKELSGGP